MRTAGATRITGAVALVGAAGVAVGVGVVASGEPGMKDVAAKASTSVAPLDDEAAAALAQRNGGAGGLQPAGTATGDDERVSRSSVRPVLASVQRETKAEKSLISRQAMRGVTQTVAAQTPKDLAMSMLSDYGWSNDQFSCLDAVYTRESNWTYTAENPSSGAYGLGQALPGEKMAVYGADWRTNPETQLKWGFAYIRDRYGSPCGAWGFWQGHSWY